MGYFWGRGTHVVEQLLSSIVLSTLNFHFDLILGLFLTFWGPNGLFLVLGRAQKLFFGCTHVIYQLSFSMLPSILIFDIDLIFGSFLTFGGENGLFFGLG